MQHVTTLNTPKPTPTPPKTYDLHLNGMTATEYALVRLALITLRNKTKGEVGETLAMAVGPRYLPGGEGQSKPYIPWPDVDDLPENLSDLVIKHY